MGKIPILSDVCQHYHQDFSVNGALETYPSIQLIVCLHWSTVMYSTQRRGLRQRLMPLGTISNSIGRGSISVRTPYTITAPLQRLHIVSEVAYNHAFLCTGFQFGHPLDLLGIIKSTSREYFGGMDREIHTYFFSILTYRRG